MNNSEEFIMKYFHDQGKEYTSVGWGTTVSCWHWWTHWFNVGPKVIGRYVGRK
jgi:hypothetical protein